MITLEDTLKPKIDSHLKDTGMENNPHFRNSSAFRSNSDFESEKAKDILDLEARAALCTTFLEQEQRFLTYA